MKPARFFLTTVCVAAALATGVAATRAHAVHVWPPDAASAQDDRARRLLPTNCGAPTDDELTADATPDRLGTNSPNSARADFDRKAAALDLAARERVAHRADVAQTAVPQALVESLLASCRYGEWSQKRAVGNLQAFADGSRRWRNAAEMRFFVYVSSAEVAVEARGVGDPALVAKLYAPIEPEIPLASVHGLYHPMRWPN